MHNMLNLLIGILIGLLSLSLMMLLHELGHYVAGRLLGFKVLEFSLFMGPRLFSRVKNGIRYSIKSLPIGASVEFAGEYPEMDEKLNPNQFATPDLKSEADETAINSNLSAAEIKERDEKAGIFYAQAKWKRFVVMAAGPAMNLITGFLAFVLYFALTYSSTTSIVKPSDYTLAQANDLQAGDRIVSYNGFNIKTDLDMIVAEKYPASDKGRLLIYERKSADGTYISKETYFKPTKLKFFRLNVVIQNENGQLKVVDSQNPDIQVGDIILKINNDEFTMQPRLCEACTTDDQVPCDLTLLRNGKEITVKAKQSVVTINKPSGLQLEAISGFGPAISYAWNYCLSVAKSTYYLLGLLIRGMMPARDAFAGPVGIVNLYSQINSANFLLVEKLLRFVQMFALISLSLGICNFIPLPPLDGSQIFLLGIEAVRGKRLSEKMENLYGYLGLFLVLGLALFTLYLDIMRIFNH